MIQLVPPTQDRLPRIFFFNMGGGPIDAGGGLGFTEGGLVHAVQSFVPLSSIYDVTVVCPNTPRGAASNEEEFNGVRISCPVLPGSVRWMRPGELSIIEHPLRVLLNWPSMVAGFIAQARRVVQAEPAVVLGNGVFTAFLSGLKQGRWATVAVIHHLYQDQWTTGAQSPPSGFYARVERVLLRWLRADAIAVVNPSVATHLVEYGFPPEKVFFVGNGVDAKRYTFSTSHDEETLVFVGRLRSAKAVDVVLDAFAIVHRQRPEAVLHIVGDGLLLGTLKSRASRLGIRERVVFHGFMDEESKLQLLSRATLYLSASRFEGFGLPVVEAMAVGAVPVVSDIPAHRYIFQDRAVGYLTATKEEMAARSLELLADPARRAEMAAAGRELVEQMWTWEQVAARYRQMIDGLLSSRAQPLACSAAVK
jgi:glycosyltransferase involved in cell wall biosynthesis